MKLLDLIGSLGEFLNNDDGTIRGKSGQFVVNEEICGLTNGSALVSCRGTPSGAAESVIWAAKYGIEL